MQELSRTSVRDLVQKSKGKWVFRFVLSLAYVICVITNFFGYAIDINHNLLICIFDFCIGCWMVELRNSNKSIFNIAMDIVLIVLIITVDIPIHNTFLMTILALSIIDAFMNASNYLFMIPFLDKFVYYINKLSYYCYLIHHVVIIYVLQNFAGECMVEKSAQLVLLVTTFMLSLFGAEIIYYIDRRLCASLKGNDSKSIIGFETGDKAHDTKNMT